MGEESGGVEGSVSIAKEKNVCIWVEHGKYKEKDWTNSDLRGVQIYEEEWSKI